VTPAHALSLPVRDLARHVRDGAVNAREIIDKSFAFACEIGAGPSNLNLVLAGSETAASEADELMERVTRAEFAARLAGVPVAVKDNIATLGMPTTCGSRILEGYLSPFESTAI
jgi:aspartyl-tRNA(Asn)/glutamyl-tRNA(Gln) amidotransferase subunit A